MPCHLSGSGRSDLVSRRSSSTRTDSSPVLVLNSVPVAREDVADVVLLESFVGLAERVALQEDLDLTGAILQLRETRLAHDALEHHAAGDMHAHRIRVEPLGGLRRRIRSCNNVASTSRR